MQLKRFCTTPENQSGLFIFFCLVKLQSATFFSAISVQHYQRKTLLKKWKNIVAENSKKFIQNLTIVDVMFGIVLSVFIYNDGFI